MGMTTDCGICGKHYQNCSHYCKEHAINPDTGKTFCGRNPSNLVVDDIDIVSGNWYGESRDPDDLCKICRKTTKWDKTVQDLYDYDLICQEVK